MKYLNTIIILIFCLVLPNHGGQIFFEKQSPDTAVLHIQFDMPLIFPVRTRQMNQLIAPLQKESCLLLSSDSKIKMEVFNEVLKEFQSQPVAAVLDISLGDSTFLDQDRAEISMHYYQQNFLGHYQNNSVFQVYFPAFIQDQNSQAVKWVEQLQLKCTGKAIQVITDPGVRKEILNSLTKRNGSDQLTKSRAFPSIARSTSSLTGKKRLKIWIRQEGLYVLHHAMIEDAGFEVSGMDPKYFRIFNRDGEVPIQVIGGEDGSFDFVDYIEFYGEPIWDKEASGEKHLHVYSNDNIYWLETGDKLGLRLGQEDVHPISQVSSSSRSYLFTEHFEEDQYFNRLPYAENVTDADHWFYGPGIADEEQKRFLFDLKQPDAFSTQLVSIRVRMRGQSQSYQSFVAEVYLNDHYVGQSEWSEREEIIIENNNFSPTYLNESDNRLTVLNKASQEALTYIYLDWFEIDYPRLYQPIDDYLRFHPPPYSSGKQIEFRIEGFTEPDVSLYKINSSRLVGNEVREVTDTLGVTTYTLIFQDLIVQENTEYLAAGFHAKHLPDSMSSVEFWNLSQSGIGADYIVIVPDDSLGEEILNPLLELRRSQGLKTLVVNIDTIYNEFNSGIPDPHAIQQFLSYAYEFWNPQPKYVLLVGDGYFDQRASAEMGNLIPVCLYQTYKYGAAPSDYYYTLLAGHDDLPDIAVGRLPVRDPEALSRVVEKIVSFENSPSDLWKNRYLMIGAGGANDVFRLQSETVIHEILPHSLSPKRLYLSGSLSDPYIGGTEDLFQHLEDGVAMVNFRGHGGGAIWSDAGLLDIDDIELIENSQTLPIMTSMTCFTADFASDRTCLGEGLVCQEFSGAVAFWGATGVGWTITDFTLLKEVYHLLEDGGIATLGELIRQAKTNFRMLNNGDIDESEIYQYVLLGDPAMRLPFPKEDVNFQITPRSVEPGTDIHVFGETVPSSVTSYFEITENNLDAVNSELYQIGQNDWQVSMSVPETMSQGKAGVRTVFWDESTHYFSHGFQSFQIGTVYFDSLMTIPHLITNQDSIGFSAVIESLNSLDQIWCEVLYPAPDSIPMIQSGVHQFKSQYRIGPFSHNQLIQYVILVKNLSGSVYSSDTLSTLVQPLPNLTVKSIELTGTDRVYLKTILRNYNSLYHYSDDPDYAETNTLDSVVIRYEMPDLSWVRFDTVSMPGIPEYAVEIPFYPPMKYMQILVTVNPDSSLAETSIQDNTRRQTMQSDRFNVTPEFGSMLQENKNGSVGLEGKFYCTIPPGAISEPSVMLLKDSIVIEEDDSGDDTVYEKYYLDFPEISGYPKLKKDMTLEIHAANFDSVGLTKIYHTTSSDGIKAVMTYEKKNNIFTVKTCDTGFFIIQKTEDYEPPTIEIQIENQPFTDNSYVSRNPSISIIIRDESGVDIRPGKIVIELNGHIQNESQFSIPDSLSDQKQVIVSYRPELKPGDYQLLILASDIHGNVQEPQLYQFKVSDVFNIHYMGNYPNPFKRETTFVYVLTESATEASLKIYTVSGRLIKTYDQYGLASPDYHEVVWDGTDDYGSEVANGVYFFKLEAKTFKQNRHVTGKIAKIR